jgi:NAD(P)-dependent dehydrogenase (short-subunit alcohol dehydrogenase family)
MDRYPDPDLRGTVAVITGGGRGLGAALAKRYARAGACVVLNGRTEEHLVRTAEEIRCRGGQAECVPGDVSKPEDVGRLFRRAVTMFETVNILVNNAGIAGPTVELVDLSLEEWNETLAINLTGAFLCCKAAIPHMREAGGGKIVNIGSGTGKRPLPMRTPYATSKLGLVGLTRTLAHEVGKYGINVNLISPFLVEGERLDLVIERQAKGRGVEPEVVRDELTALSPFKRGVSADDVADVALFLSSPAADSMTGQDINVSAGAVMY